MRLLLGAEARNTVARRCHTRTTEQLNMPSCVLVLFALGWSIYDTRMYMAGRVNLDPRLWTTRDLNIDTIQTCQTGAYHISCAGTDEEMQTSDSAVSRFQSPTKRASHLRQSQRVVLLRSQHGGPCSGCWRIASF